jgi:hypothetical protein
MTKNKKYIPKKLKEYTARLFDNKCFFCRINLSNAKNKQKHHHHFKKESDGAGTYVDTIVLCCDNCHKKVHKKVKLNALIIRKILIDILSDCLHYKNKFNSEHNLILNEWNLNLEYLYFRKSIYLNLCSSLEIIPTIGDMYNYDDDITFNNYGMIEKKKVQIIKSILSRLDKKIGLMKIKKVYTRPTFKENDKEREIIINIVLEWFDSLFIDNDRKKLDEAFYDFILKGKEGRLTNNDLNNIKNIIDKNQSFLAKKQKEFILGLD